MSTIQQRIWQARILLEIRLATSESRLFDQSEPYAVTVPRLSYLPFLLPRLLKFFQEDLIGDVGTLDANDGQFSHEGVLLKWHLPLGLLYDIYVLSSQDVAGGENTGQTSTHDSVKPFCLTVHFTSMRSDQTIRSDPATVHDSFINSVKEADFVRSGTAKPIMSLSATESKLLWSAVQDNNLNIFAPILQKLLPETKSYRNIPIRIFLPVVPSDNEVADEVGEVTLKTAATPVQGRIRVIQSQLPPYIPITTTGTGQSRTQIGGHGSPQTLGTALHTLLSTLFPSRRTPILARPLLHGTTLPMNSALVEVASQACYADGWINIVIVVNG